MSRPKINLAAAASRYASPGERIAEFGNGKTGSDYKGGLISVRNKDDGTLVVEVYRADPGVTVLAPRQETSTP